MPIEIKNHSDGTIAGVSPEHQLLVRAESHSIQHHLSWVEGRAFQAIVTDTGITAQNQTILHLKNIDPTRKLVVTYIRLLDMSSITTHVVGNRFMIGLGDTISSGGDTITPVNMNAGSGVVAAMEAKSDPVVAGTFTEIDRVYTKAGEQVVYNKSGSLILGLNDTLSIQFLSTGTGAATARVTFMMLDNEH